MSFPKRPLASLLGSNGPVHAVTYSASPGTYILTGSADRLVRLYNPTGGSDGGRTVGKLIQTYDGHGYEVLSVAVAGDNERFASAGGDRAVFLWDVATATTMRRLGGSGGHTARVNAVALAGPGDGLVVSAGADTRVHVWDARAPGRPVQTLADARDAVAAVAARGPVLLAGSVDGRLRAYDFRTARVVTDVVGASVTGLCPARDGRAVLVSALDSAVRLMDRTSGACLRAYAAPGWRNEELRVQAVLGGGERWVVAGDEMSGPPPVSADSSGAAADPVAAVPGRVWAWDLLSGELVATVPVPWGPGGAPARRMAVGRDGKAKARANVVSCVAWKDDGWGDQFCVGGTSGVVTVFGP